MTKEQASLQELGLSEAQLAERQDRVKQLIGTGTTHPASMADLAETAPIKPPKKRRSDAGKPRVKPEPPAAATGKLTREDASRLVDLIKSTDMAREEYAAAQDAADAKQDRWVTLEAEREAFIADHTA